MRWRPTPSALAQPQVIVFNKWLLAFSGFPHPITLTAWHMLFCSTVGLLAVRVLGLVPSHNLSAREYTRRVLPIGALGLQGRQCWVRGAGAPAAEALCMEGCLLAPRSLRCWQICLRLQQQHTSVA